MVDLKVNQTNINFLTKSQFDAINDPLPPEQLYAVGIESDSKLKSLITSWGMPDYSSPITISNNTDYNIPYPSILLVYAGAGTYGYGGNVFITINGTEYTIIGDNTPSGQNRNTITYLFDTGDVIKFTMSGNSTFCTANLFPLKGTK